MSSQTRQHVAQAVKAIEGKKGEDVVILEMDKSSGAFTDYFVVCSGTNPRQIQAIADDVQKNMAAAGQRPNSVEGYTQAEWVLLDYVDFVLHIFSERARKFYDLERLWKSARKLSPADLAKKPATKKQAASRKVSASKKSAAAPRKAARGKTHAQNSKTKKKSRKSA
jgi:ribosome-associated protein